MPDTLAAAGAGAAVVTGSAGGLGRAIVEEILSWGEVTVYGLDVAEQEPPAGDFHAVRCDVTDPGSVSAAATQVASAGSPLRYVIANAGRYPNRPFSQWDSAQFEDLWRLNVGGTFNVAQAFLPLMTQADWSRLVAVSSNAALLGVPGFAPYSSTKAALLGLVRGLAAEYADQGVTANAMAPGLTRTATALSSDVAPFFDAVVEGQMVRKPLEAADLLPALRYLCDPAAAMTTGQTVVVDGGTVLQ